MVTEKFLGVPYPLERDSRGYFHSQSGMNQIKSDLLILLLTNPGERVMLPTFGTGLRKLLFEPNDSDLASTARELIITAIRNWETRVAVEQIEVLTSIDPSSLAVNDDRGQDGNILMIRINFFDPQNTNEVQELSLALPINGSV